MRQLNQRWVHSGRLYCSKLDLHPLRNICRCRMNITRRCISAKSGRIVLMGTKKAKLIAFSKPILNCILISHIGVIQVQIANNMILHISFKAHSRYLLNDKAQNIVIDRGVQKILSRTICFISCQLFPNKHAYCSL
ncbi:hypothetical protein D3C78_1199720 [compost metagenome]